MIEAKPKTEASLRDFVYLDWERVRSLSAQLLGASRKTRRGRVGTTSVPKGRCAAASLLY